MACGYVISGLSRVTDGTKITSFCSVFAETNRNLLVCYTISTLCFMTPAEICSLSQASLDKVRALKQDFDAAFEVLTVSGSKEHLQKIEALQRQIEEGLRTPRIARSLEQISDKTFVYIGKLEPGIFKKFPESIDHIYTSFPEGRLPLKSLKIGDKTRKQLWKLMQKNSVKMSDDAKFMMHSADFRASQQPEQIRLIRLRLRDLGLSGRPTTDEVYARIAELGLELCPPTTGPYYRLAYLNQHMDGWVGIGMKPITGQHGYPRVFNITCSPDGRWLSERLATQDSRWNPDGEMLFRVPKKA